jgi:glycosyltransferase involved in cell wall biosynthesis
MNEPTIAFVIPTFNVESFIEECLQSVKDQTYENFTCVIVDDCSIDGTVKLIENFIKDDPRFILEVNEKNIGSSLTRQKGYKLVRADYIYFIDADDYIMKNMLEAFMDTVKDFRYDMVCHNRINFGAQALRDGNEMVERLPLFSKQYLFEQIILQFHCTVNRFYKYELLEKIEFPEQSYCEDTYINTQAIYFAKSFGYMDKILYFYRFNINSITHQESQVAILKKKKERLIIFHKTKLFLQSVNCYDKEIFRVLEKKKRFIISGSR